MFLSTMWWNILHAHRKKWFASNTSPKVPMMDFCLLRIAQTSILQYHLKQDTKNRDPWGSQTISISLEVGIKTTIAFTKLNDKIKFTTFKGLKLNYLKSFTNTTETDENGCLGKKMYIGVINL